MGIRACLGAAADAYDRAHGGAERAHDLHMPDAPGGAELAARQVPEVRNGPHASEAAMTEPAPRLGWIARVIAASAHRPFLTILFVIVLSAWGVVSLRDAPLDAIPDTSDVQVIVFTEWMGQSPDLVEDQVTYPISASLLAAPKVQAVRGTSMFGMSFVNVIFEDGTDLYWARSRVLEYMSSVRAKLPQSVNPTLGPDATGVGWVFEYALVDKTGKHDLADLRALQDWNVRYALSSVPGVAEVASVGGFVKQYQVNVDPNKLLARGVTMDDVVSAVRASNQEVGGRVLEIAGHEHVIRGRGYVKSTDDIGKTPIKTIEGTPIRVADVADVSLGPDLRRGLSELNGRRRGAREASSSCATARTRSR